MSICTPDLCDNFPDDVSVLEPLLRNFGGINAFGGPISTVKCHEDNSLVKSALDEPGKGRVLVVDGGGSMRRALLGDLLAQKAVSNGWAGVIVYGCIRDVDVIATLPLGVQAIAANPLKTDKRNEGQRDITLRFGGVEFVPGHHVYADNNGVIVAPKSLL
jgi:regulator of ribonuclease activity A